MLLMMYVVSIIASGVGCEFWNMSLPGMQSYGSNNRIKAPFVNREKRTIPALWVNYVEHSVSIT